MHLRHKNESSISHFLPKREKIYSFFVRTCFFWYEQKAESILLTLLYKERGVLPFYGRYEVCCMEACFVKK